MSDLAQQALELCWEIEKFPASEHQTATVLKASALHQALSRLSTTIAPVATAPSMAELRDFLTCMKLGGELNYFTRNFEELLSHYPSDPIGAEQAAKEAAEEIVKWLQDYENWRPGIAKDRIIDIILKHSAAPKK